MTRLAIVLPLLLLAGCADPSKGAAFNACWSAAYLQDPSSQQAQVANCMKTASFESIAQCSPEADGRQWTWRGNAPATNPECYRPTTSRTWLATLLSPM